MSESHDQPETTAGDSQSGSIQEFDGPRRWSATDRHDSLYLSEDGRTVTCTVPHRGDRQSAVVRAENFVPPRYASTIYYYEVEILERGTKGHISIGFCTAEVPLDRLPGWSTNSWGYHADDGWFFPGNRDGNPYGPTFNTGDTIGCGIDLTEHKMFYTKNGIFLGMAGNNVGKGVELYPVIGMRHESESARANFGQEAFKYNLEAHIEADVKARHRE